VAFVSKMFVGQDATSSLSASSRVGDSVFVGFCRVFSGVVCVGDELYSTPNVITPFLFKCCYRHVLAPRYNPMSPDSSHHRFLLLKSKPQTLLIPVFISKANPKPVCFLFKCIASDLRCSQCKITQLYMLMGRDLLPGAAAAAAAAAASAAAAAAAAAGGCSALTPPAVSQVCAGCVCGIGGLGGHILKYATLSSTPFIRPISFLTKATGNSRGCGVCNGGDEMAGVFFFCVIFFVLRVDLFAAPVVAVAVEPKHLQQVVGEVWVHMFLLI
jgi:hypothetical protein